MAQTLEQKIAAKEAELSRLRDRSRQVENGQKIILGGMLMTAARRDQRIREWVIRETETYVTREVDQKRIAPLIEELRAEHPSQSPQEPQERR